MVSVWSLQWQSSLSLTVVTVCGNARWTGLTATWTKIVTKAKSFASQHGISEVEIVERCRAKRPLAGEEARDERKTMVKRGQE